MMLLVNGSVWILAGGSYAMLREMGLCVTRDVLVYSMVSGTSICAIANFLLLALQSGDASIIVPIANMSFLVTLIKRAHRLINDEENAIDAQTRPVEDGCQACTKFKIQKTNGKAPAAFVSARIEFRISRLRSMK